MFAVSYDSVDVLHGFAQEHRIEYSLLSDEDSAVIRRFGILNTLVRPDEAIYGIPFPGSYLVGADGRVVEKFFHHEYQIRESGPTVLRAGFGMPLDLGGFPSAKAAQVSAVLAAESLTFMQPVDLYVRIALKEGLHVYGKPTPEGYLPAEVTVTGPDGLRVREPLYPPTRPFRVEGLDEPLHVYEGDLEVVVPLLPAIGEGESVTLDIAVRYQACDERQCFLPQTEHVRLDVPLGRLNRPPRRE